MSEYRRGSHPVHDIKYYLVWVTKYRYPVLRGDIGTARRPGHSIRRACEERDAMIIKGHVSRDHIHLLVSTPPNVAPSDLVQSVKGKSARLLFEEFPSLRKRYWRQHLWGRFFCASVGTVTDKVIAEYIAHQDKPLGESFTVGDDRQRASAATSSRLQPECDFSRESNPPVLAGGRSVFFGSTKAVDSAIIPGEKGISETPKEIKRRFV